MPKLYVKLDENNNVIEACPHKLEGGVQVDCTAQEKINIMNQYDAISDGVKINSTIKGENANKYEQMKIDKAAQKALEKQQEDQQEQLP